MKLEEKLTVDDLIIEYTNYRLKMGYEPSYTTGEFMAFLYFFEKRIHVQDAVYYNKKLFQRFFERKSQSHWSVGPHMSMVYSEEKDDYVIKPNYSFGDYDMSVINTYRASAELRDTITSALGEFFVNVPKRDIDESINPSESNENIGKQFAAEFIYQIWDSFVNGQIKDGSWPQQCTDIEKYLLEMDLAPIIDLPSIREKLLNFYKVLSKRTAILIEQEGVLRVSNREYRVYERANYELLIRGFENIAQIAFGPKKKCFDFDTSTNTFDETHEFATVVYWDDDDREFKTTKTSLNSSYVNRLAKKMDKHNNL